MARRKRPFSRIFPAFLGKKLVDFDVSVSRHFEKYPFVPSAASFAKGEAAPFLFRHIP
jgi:hypothetical protein